MPDPGAGSLPGEYACKLVAHWEIQDVATAQLTLKDFPGMEERTVQGGMLLLTLMALPRQNHVPT